jgi:DNA polymerase IV
MAILHLDLDAFFASVESIIDPGLCGKPVVVAMGNPDGRGVVSTASYEARVFGVHSAMPLREAKRLCPQAIFVPPNFHAYSQYSRRVMDLLREFSPLVEQVSIDEAYVEIPSDREPLSLGREIQSRVKSEIGLDCTIAVAANKLVAKVACNAVKPRGLIVVPAGEEALFLAPLAIEKLPGAGKVTRAKLSRWNVKTIGDLARVPAAELRAAFGKTGSYLHHAALGQDDSPIVTEWKNKSISQENTFERDTRDPRQLVQLIAEMSERISGQLKKDNTEARTVVLKLRYEDFTTITRQTTLSFPTCRADLISKTATDLLRAHWQRKRAIRLIGVGAHNLIEATDTRQLEMFADGV